jgi:hypothetical protein
MQRTPPQAELLVKDLIRAGFFLWWKLGDATLCDVAPIKQRNTTLLEEQATGCSPWHARVPFRE